MSNEVDGVYLPCPVTEAELDENREYISTTDKTVPCEPVMKTDIEAINAQESQSITDFDENKLEESDKITLVIQGDTEPSMKPEQQVEEDKIAQPGVLFDEDIKTDAKVDEEQALEELPSQEAVRKAEQQQEETVEQAPLIQFQDEELKANEITTAFSIREEKKELTEVKVERPGEMFEEQMAAMHTEEKVLAAKVEATEVARVMEADGSPVMEKQKVEPEVTAEEVLPVEIHDEDVEGQETVHEPLAEMSAQQHITVTEVETTTATVTKEIRTTTFEREQIAEEIPPFHIQEQSVESTATDKQIPIVEDDDKVLLAGETAAATDNVTDVTVVEDAEIKAVAEAKGEMEEEKAVAEEAVEGSTLEAVQHETVEECEDTVPFVPSELEDEGKEDKMETEAFVEQIPFDETQDEMVIANEKISETPLVVEDMRDDICATETVVVTDMAREELEPCQLQGEEEIGDDIHRESIVEPFPISQEKMVTQVQEPTLVTQTEVIVVTATADVESYKPVSKEDVEEISAASDVKVDRHGEMSEEQMPAMHAGEKVLAAEVEATEIARVMEADGSPVMEKQKVEPEVTAEEVLPVEIHDEDVERQETVQEPLAEMSAQQHITVTEIETTTTTVTKEIETTTFEREQIAEEIPPVDIQEESIEPTATDKQIPIIVEDDDKVLLAVETIKVTAAATDNVTDVTVVEEAEIEPVAEANREVEEEKAVAEEAVEGSTLEAVQHETLDEHVATSEVKVVTLLQMEELTAMDKQEELPRHELERSYEEVQSMETRPDDGRPTAEVDVLFEFKVVEITKSKDVVAEAAVAIPHLPVRGEPCDTETTEVEAISMIAETEVAQIEEEKEFVVDVQSEEIEAEGVELSSVEMEECVTATGGFEAVDDEKRGYIMQYEEPLLECSVSQRIEATELLEKSSDEMKSITMIRINQELETWKPQSSETTDVASGDAAASPETQVTENQLEMEVAKDITDRMTYDTEMREISILKTEFTAEEVSAEPMAASSAAKYGEPIEVEEVEEEVELIKQVLESTQVEVEETELKPSVVEKDVTVNVNLLQLEQTAAGAAETEDVGIRMAAGDKTELAQKSTEETVENGAELMHSATAQIETYELISETDKTWPQSTGAYEITTAKVLIEEREEVAETSSEDVEPFVLQAPEAESSVSEEVRDESMKAVAGDQISDEELESDLELLLEESRIKYDISRCEVSDPLLELLPQDIAKESTVEYIASPEKVAAEEELKHMQNEGTLIAEDEVPAAESVEMPDRETKTETKELCADLQVVSSCMVEEMVLKVSQQTLMDDTGIVYPQTLSCETETSEPSDSENAEHKQPTETVAEEEVSQEHDSSVEVPGQEGKSDTEGVETHTSEVDELSTSEEMIENDYTSDASIVMQLHTEEAQVEVQPGSDEADISTVMRFEPDKVVQPSDEIESSNIGLLKAKPVEESFVHRDDRILLDEPVEAAGMPDVECSPLESEGVTVVAGVITASSIDDSKEVIQEVAASLVGTIVKRAEKLESSEKLPDDDTELQKSRDVNVPQTLVAEGGRSTVMQVVRSVKPDGEIVEQVVTTESASALEALGALPSPQTSLCGENGEELEPAVSSTVIVYADTVEERPDTETEMTEYQEFLPDGTLVRRKVVKTTRHEAVTRRVVVQESSLQEHDQPSTQFEASPAFLRYSDRVEEEPLTLTLKDETYSDTLSDGRSIVTHSMVTSQQKLVMERTFVDAVDNTMHADIETMENLSSGN